MIGRGKNQRNKLQHKRKDNSQYGVCSCPRCHYSVTHKRGVPCSTLSCPRCNIPLIRQAMPENINIQQVPDKYTNTSTFPIIDAALCIGCSACVNKCPSQAIILEDGKAKITTSNCKNCRLCISICPVGAIS